MVGGCARTHSPNRDEPAGFQTLRSRSDEGRGGDAFGQLFESHPFRTLSLINISLGLRRIMPELYKNMEQETKQLDLSSKVYKLVVAVIVLVAVFYFGQLMYNFQTLPQNYPQEISVSGQGKTYAKPDVAVLVLGVESRGSKVSDIVKDNTNKMNKIIKDVKDLGVDEKDIQTTQYSITPEYNWTERSGRVFVGYILNQQITAKIRDFEKIGTILDKATADGANAVGDLQFTIDSPEKVQAEARAKAIDQAKEKAKVLAGQSGLKIVKLVNVSEGYQSTPQPLYKNAGGMGLVAESASPAPDIQAGQMEVNVTITLTYRVK